MIKTKLSVFFAMVLIASMILSSCATATTAPVVPTTAPTTVPTKAPPVAPTTAPTIAPTEPPVVEPTVAPAVPVVLAIEHFSVIAGTTWSGAQDRAGKRIAEKYPNVTYIFRENVAPDQSVPFAEEMIANDKANIVVGKGSAIVKNMVSEAPIFPA